ncbi:MAG: ABC transporter ATP-binding protein, partial [Bacteroidia bacterium]|nr:ABC transporter ATP-binding protein [Bacteroidia bacterium]MDW8333937.1 ABC transporter ATP-binding protein [Bacteroidia bacterium]
MDDAVLRVRGLRIEILGRPVVNNVEFDLQRATTTAIVGESGSGKTLSALSILGLLPAGAVMTAGEILFRDREYILRLDALKKTEWRKVRGKKISMIFQEPAAALNPAFTVGRQTLEVIAAHERLSRNTAQERVLELYAEMGLENPRKIFNSYPHQLSGGQQQRAMIAMALACRPDVLLADEPTTALDPTIRQKVVGLLEELRQKRGLSIVFISHDLTLVKRIAWKVVVLRAGKVVESGWCDDVLHRPRHAYTRALWACRPRLGYRPHRLPTVDDTDSTSVGGSTPPSVSSSQSPLLEVRGLKVEYFSEVKFTAVNDVSFNVYKGEILGLAGESGSGKSSLGKALLKLVPASGEVFYHDEGAPLELLKLDQRSFRPYRKHLQIIFQDPYGSLNPKMTVRQILVEPMRVHRLFDNDRIRTQKAAELLEKVGMSADLLNRLPHAL